MTKLSGFHVRRGERFATPRASIKEGTMTKKDRYENLDAVFENAIVSLAILFLLGWICFIFCIAYITP